MTTTIPVTTARKDLLKLIDIVDDRYTRVDLTKKGVVKATLISPDYLDSLEETVYSLKYSRDDIVQAEKEIKRGDAISLEELRKEIDNAG